MNYDTAGDAAVISDLALQAGGANNEGMIPYVVLGKDQKVQFLPELLEKPTRIQETVRFWDTHSFVRYVLEFGDDLHARIFADAGNRAVTCYLDYHLPSGTPAWCDHRAILGMKPSNAWSAWSLQSNRWLTQEGLAEFLEDRAEDIASPPAARVIQAASHLEAKKGVAFVSAVNVQGGGTEFTYTEKSEAKGKGTLTIPNRLTLEIPVFEYGKPRKVEVRLRYKIHEDKVTFLLAVARLQEHPAEAFQDVLNDLTAAGLTDIFLGVRG